MYFLGMTLVEANPRQEADRLIDVLTPLSLDSVRILMISAKISVQN